MPKIIYDQHFLIVEKILQFIVEAAEIKKEDVVLEIGAGGGNLTRKIAPRARKVIAIEIDQRFKGELEKLPGKVEVIYGKALEVLKGKKDTKRRKFRSKLTSLVSPKGHKFLEQNLCPLLDFNKIVANLPYQICEPFFHYLCLAKEVQLSILTVPKKFAKKAQEHPIFSAFLEIKILKEVGKKAFFPRPRVTSAVVSVTRKESFDENSFIRRKLYLQREKKLKSGLREALIDLYYFKQQRKLTKKQALGVMAQLDFSSVFLEKPIKTLHPQEYQEISRRVEKIKF